ncbi:HEAT repeat domain-containing protein [Tumidithrix elongata RA019]|uniref:HEAT repeat domain-containing protein n=1 Tax=Tumidithrix elongata BACA0141 TaxID=2716417 RepID=A0AAW9Q547_9CYAN|nr:HEAT repeat domain-containing protein [Tumidithrix elongata RA019]
MSEDQSQQSAVALTPESAIASLRSPDLSQRYYAAWWLGKMRVREAVDALIVALEDNDDRTDLGGYPLRRIAARALGKLGNPSAIPALLKSLSCEDFYVREAAAQAIEAIAASSPESFNAAQVCTATLTRLLQSKVIDSVKLEQPYEAILEALGRLKAVSSQTAVEPYLQHRLPRIRFAAARAMYGLTGASEYAELLVKGLEDPDINLRQAVLTDLGEIGYLPAVEAIAQCQTENSFKLFALKSILDMHLPKAQFDLSLTEPLQQVMLYMDDLL